MHFTSPNAYDFHLANKPAEFDIFLAGIVYEKIDENNFTTNFSGLTLYLIHECFYNKMLALPEEEHIDRGLSWYDKFVVCDPMAVIPHNGYSDSSKRFIDYAPHLRGKKLYLG